MLDLGLAGKVAIVTGGSGGLGLAFAEGLVDAGAKVAIADIKARSRGSRPRQSCATRRRGDRLCRRRLGRSARREAMVARTLDAFGALDILVNNAGVYATLKRKPFYEISVEEWDRVMAVNLRGVFLCAKAAAKHMIAAGRGGRIINIASATVFSRLAALDALCRLEGRRDRHDARDGARTRRSSASPPTRSRQASR